MLRDTRRVVASGVPSAEREEQVYAGRPVVVAVHVARPVPVIGAPLVTVAIPVPVPVVIVLATVAMPLSMAVLVSVVVLSMRMSAAMSLPPMPVLAVADMTAVAPVVDRVDKRLFGSVHAAALVVHCLR